MKKRIILGVAIVLVVGGGIAAGVLWKGSDNSGTNGENQVQTAEVVKEMTVPTADEKNAVVINLKQDGTSCHSDKVQIAQNEIKIKEKGTYILRGSLSDGKIKVNANENADVILVLDGATVMNKSGKAVECKDAKTFSIQAKADTKNLLQNGEAGGVEEKGAAVASVCDMSIAGDGELRIKGYRKHGVRGDNGILFAASNCSIDALQDGVNADVVQVTGGTLTIQSGDDGIHADSSYTMRDGKVIVEKAKEGVEGNQISIEGGELNITSEDDGINAYGGQSLMGKGPMERQAEEEDADKEDEKANLPMSNLNISGGKIVIDAEGDGLDSNGSINVSGGETVVHGPVNGGNGALDSGSESGGTITIQGGTLIAVGSSRMAETFDETSAQCSILHVFDESFAAGDKLVITDESGKELYQHMFTKSADSVVFSSPELKKGSTYTFKYGEKSVEVKQESVSESNSNYQGMGGGAGKGGFQRGNKDDRKRPEGAPKMDGGPGGVNAMN